MSRITEDLKIQFQGEVHDLGAHIDIDRDDLDAEFSRQAALVSWWGVMAEQASHDLRRAEADFQGWLAVTFGQLRAQAEATKAKMTEAKLEQTVHSLPQFLEWKQRINDLKHQAGVLRTATRGIEEKGRMLVSLGALRRSEVTAFGSAT